MAVLSQIVGAYSMTNYSEKLFKNGNLSLCISIVIASIQLFANCATFMLFDFTGNQRILITISAAGTTAGLIFMELYKLFIYPFDDTYGWVPVALISTIILMVSFGILSIVIAISNIISPQKADSEE